jgi:hypothetical protein
MGVPTHQQITLLLQMYWAMVKNKIGLMTLLFAVPIFCGFLILLAMAITYLGDMDAFTTSQIIFNQTPVCGSGLIGVYPPDHPISKWLLEQYHNPNPSPLDALPNVVAIEDDFTKNCIDKLYDKSPLYQHQSILGCLNFEKVVNTTQPFPTSAPTKTNIVQYDVYAISYQELLEPMNAGEYYRFEENPDVNDVQCSLEFLTRANNLASVGVLHHYGLYDNVNNKQPSDDEFQQQTSFIHSLSTQNDALLSNQQLGIELLPTKTTINPLTTQLQDNNNFSTLQNPPKHNPLGPLDINTRLMDSKDPYRTHGGLYTTFLAQQSLTIILFLPILLLTLIPYTKFKQDGQISLLLLNGINHFSIVLAMVLFSLSNGIFPMFVYSYVLFFWWYVYIFFFILTLNSNNKIDSKYCFSLLFLSSTCLFFEFLHFCSL